MSDNASQAELHRLHILHEYFSPQLPLPKDLDELVEVAAQLCGTSMAAIGFVDEAHERYAVTQGFAPTAVNRHSSLGDLVISERKPVAVGDVRHDPRFSQCQPVVDQLDVEFYAAAPLLTTEGDAIGELAVMNDRPVELSADQLHGLETLANQVMVHLDLWRHERNGAAQSAGADPAVGFQDIFNAVPNLYWAVTPHDFRVVAVSDAFLAATETRREDVIGRCIFDTFPSDPDDPASQDNIASLKASLQRVQDTWREDVMPAQRYPIARPSEGGRFEERFWSAINKPVTGRDGKLKYILHRTEDITERRRTEVDAKLLGERLSTVLENISDAFLTLDNDWRVTFMNSKAVELLFRSREELLGENVWDFFPEAVHTRFYEMYQIAGKEKRTVRFEEYFAPLDVWLDVSAFPSPEGLAIYFRDISERKRIEAAKRESEQLTALILENALDAVISIDSSSVIKVWNTQAEHIFGWSQEEAIGRKLHELIIPERFRDAHRRGIARFLASGEGPLLNRRVEIFGLRKDGEEFPVELAISPIKTGADYTFSAFVRDITEQKEYERKLSRQAALLDKAQDAIIVCDSNHRIQYWNKGAERLYGWTAEEALGQSKDQLLYFDSGPYHEAFHEVMEHGEWTGEVVQHRKDGSIITVEGAWSLVNDEDAPVAILAINTDITQRLALEEQLRQSQRLESIGQLTGGVAHDFNNLLTVILGNAEMMVSQLPPQDMLHKLADMTRTAALRGSELTHRLLAFARRQALEPKRVDVNELVAGMESLLRRALPEHVNIEVVLSDNLWIACVDPAQLESVLLNLALNSKDAMPDGGRLTIETGNAQLDEEYAVQHAEVAPGRYVMVAVSDTGTGIPPEALERVFDPFYTTKEQGKGTGLGLSMAYGFAKQSEGHIKIYSEPGQGTTVKVYLPRASGEEDVAESADNGQPLPDGTETILVVEDDDLVREYAQGQLEQLGYRVIAASNGAEALQLIQETARIDLLFTDVIMSGGMNGPELVEKAKQLRPQLNVLYTSGYTENAIVHHGRLDPGVQLLQKPYQRAELARKIRHVLS